MLLRESVSFPVLVKCPQVNPFYFGIQVVIWPHPGLIPAVALSRSGDYFVPLKRAQQLNVHVSLLLPLSHVNPYVLTCPAREREGKTGPWQELGITGV